MYKDFSMAAQFLSENILPFWEKLEDKTHGGFFGETDFNGKPVPEADKGGIINSRILWTFSAAYRVLKDESYKKYAGKAFAFLQKAFWDKDYGGLYWLADATGKPIEKKKHFYNNAFGIYALSEYYLAFGDKKALQMAMELFVIMEKHGRDAVYGGYIESCGEKWEAIDDFRLSDKDMNAPKSMNTNLHVMEAYTNLLIATDDERVKEALRSLVRVTLDKIIENKKTFLLFFDVNWRVEKAGISYGHDIEGSWLLHWAAMTLDDFALLNEVEKVALNIAESTYNIAIDHKNGGLLSGKNRAGELQTKKEWWPQAEAVVGFYNAYTLSEDVKYKDIAEKIWVYINNFFIDRENGEWHNELFPDNTPDTAMPKTGFWKCPYHNGRMCIELIKRLS